MTNSLKTIQVLAKIGRVCSKIIFICCIVGTAGCILGMASVAAGVDEILKLGGVTLHGIIGDRAGVSDGNLYAGMATGAVLCISEGILAGFAANYFQNELAAGTPFTLHGAKELLRLGILAVCIPIGGTVLAAIIHAVMENLMTGITEQPQFDVGAVSLGVMMIVMSVICRYGAECLAARDADKPTEE